MKKIFVILFSFVIFNTSSAESKIAYININYILNYSIVGKSITEHLNIIKEKKLNEFQSIEKSLSDKEKNILKKKNIISKDDFNNEVELLKKEIVQYKNKKKQFNNEIEKKKINYTKKVLEALNIIISKYVEDNSIQIVFSKKDIIIAKKDLDITNSVMNLLNNQMVKIEF